MASLKFKEIICLIYSGLLFISGLILMGFSSYLLFKIFYYYSFIPSGSIGPFSVIFLLGIAHVLLTWLGIKGPTREHNFHILLFMTITLILIACEVAVGIWSIILWDEVDIASIELMTASFDEIINYRGDWNKLQSQFHCCGVNGKDDYKKIDYFPTSCSLDEKDTNNTLIYSEGCKRPLVKYAKSILMDGAIIGFLCAFFQAIGLFFFITYFRTLRKERVERIARRSAVQRDMANAVQIPSQTQHPLGSGSNNGAGSKETSQPPGDSSASPPTTPPASAPT